jgi:WD40 repeat protein
MRLLLCFAVVGVGCPLANAAVPLINGPAVRALTFSPDGKFIAATSAEPEESGHATVWELPTAKLLFHHTEPKGIPAAAFSPDGKCLVLGSFTENALVIDTATWKTQRQLGGHGKAARGLAFSHDGKTLAVTSYDGFINLWDTATWTVHETLENAHGGWVYAAAFSKDGKTLASCSADNTAKLWDLKTGKNLHTFTHDGIVRRILFTPDDRHVVYPSWDGSLSIRDRATGNPVADFDRFGSGDDVAVTPDGKVLAVVSGEAKLLAVDLSATNEATAREVRRLMNGWGDDRMAVREQASKDIAALGIPALAELRKAAKEAPSPETRLRARQALSAILAPEPLRKMSHPDGEIQSLAISPDGQTVATGGVDGVVRLWNIASGRETLLLRQFPPSAKVPRSTF